MKSFRKVLIILATGLLIPVLLFSQNTYTVTSTGDNGGVNPAPGAGTGTLRQAIVDANANIGADNIHFNISGTGVRVINLIATLPVITDQMGVTINGYTQPGASANTNPQGVPSNAVLLIQVNGNSGIDGFYSQTWRTTIRGIVITNFNIGITIDGTTDGANMNSVEGCYIGTNAAGTSAQGNNVGVEVNNGASGTMNGITIGNGTDGGRNVISGNGVGIKITGPGTGGVGIIGNYIGLNKDGNAGISNITHGVLIEMGAANNMIGSQSTSSPARNIISWNAFGIEIKDPGTSGNTVINNYIGTDANGTNTLGNSGSGIRLSNGTTGNTVGSYSGTAYRNVISGNGGGLGYSGIDILGAGTSSNTIEANYIGLDATGSSAIPNTGSGISIFQQASGNTIGGLTPNVISGNIQNGVYIGDSATTANLAYNNLIGLDATGLTVVANGANGVLVELSASSNFIGSSGSNPNYIAGNSGDGIKIKDFQTDFNTIQRNFIGWNTAMTATGNAGDGIEISGGPWGTQIGGTNIFESNDISNNSGHGIFLDNASGTQIISAPSLTTLPNIINNNSLDGISVTNSSSFGNTISKNSTSGNGGLGIDLNNDGITANDLSDPDTGPNTLLNYPVIASCNWFNSGPGTTDAFILGTIDIDTPPNLATVELYSVSAPDPTGHGEGDGYLGNCTPDATGNWAVVIPNMSMGNIITATTTDLNGNTSEFSLNDTVRQLDFGDAPAPCASDFFSNGPRHLVVTGAPFLGDPTDAPDADPDSWWLMPFADSDDNMITDDEDGLNIPNYIYAGIGGTISFTVQNGPGWVDGWIDYDKSGTFGDMPGNAEHIVSGSYSTGGPNNVSITLPAGTKLQHTFVRFRISSSGPLSPLGYAADGEVEDHDIWFAVQWLGGTSGSETDWATASNWSNGTVPSGAMDVVITGGMAHYPDVNTTATCHNLTIFDGAQITVSSSANFTIQNDMTLGQGSSGTYTQNGGYCKVVGITYVKSGATLTVSGGTFVP